MQVLSEANYFDTASEKKVKSLGYIRWQNTRQWSNEASTSSSQNSAQRGLAIEEDILKTNWEIRGKKKSRELEIAVCRGKCAQVMGNKHTSALGIHCIPSLCYLQEITPSRLHNSSPLTAGAPTSSTEIPSLLSTGGRAEGNLH